MWYDGPHDQTLRPQHRPARRVGRPCRHIPQDAATLCQRAARGLRGARRRARTCGKTHEAGVATRGSLRSLQGLRTGEEGEEGMNVQAADVWGIAAVALYCTGHWVGATVCAAIALVLVAWNVWWTR